MDVVVRGRGDRIDARTKEHLQQKLSRLARLDRRIDRIDVEVTFETSERIDGGHRLEASARSGRSTYRAHAVGEDVEIALNRLIERLERQISDTHRRGRHKASGTPSKVQSGRMGSNDHESPDLT